MCGYRYALLFQLCRFAGEMTVPIPSSGDRWIDILEIFSRMSFVCYLDLVWNGLPEAIYIYSEDHDLKVMQLCLQHHRTWGIGVNDNFKPRQQIGTFRCLRYPFKPRPLWHQRFRYMSNNRLGTPISKSSFYSPQCVGSFCGQILWNISMDLYLTLVSKCDSNWLN